MKKVLRVFSYAAMAVGAAAALTSCGGKSDTIKIGMIANMSGSAQYYGIQVQHGVEMAVDEINANGGISGKQIELVEKDDAQDATTAVQQYEKIADSVDFIVGPVISSTSEAVAKVAADDGMPMITPSGSAASITKNRESVFRVCFTDPGQGTTLAQLCKSKGYKKVVVYQNTGSDYSMGVAQTFINNASANGVTVVGNQAIGYTDDNLSAQMETYVGKIDETVDAVVFPDYTNNDYQFAKAVHTAFPNMPILGSDGWDGAEATKNATLSYLDNCFYTTNVYSGDTENKAVAKFYSEFSAKYSTSDVSQFAAMAYDAVYIAKQAIESANSTDHAKVVAAMKNVHYSGVVSTSLTFDENGDPSKTTPVVEFKNGKVTYAGAF